MAFELRCATPQRSFDSNHGCLALRS